MDETEAFQPVAVEADPENAMGDDPTINAFRIDDNDERFDDEIFWNTTTNHHTYYFGSCCDFRMAVMWVNMIWIAVNLGVLIFYIANSLTKIETRVIVLEIVAIAMSAIGFYGALKFKYRAVFAASISHGTSFVITVIYLRTFDAANIIARLVHIVLYLYPHICLLRLMEKGIIRESNYNTISSCCGNPNPSTDPKDHHMYFFGCCCDFRRAVLVLNVISIVIRLLVWGPQIQAMGYHYGCELLHRGSHLYGPHLGLY
jgi:hypothetical protein